jgi:serine/threonine protein kinase
MTGLVDEPPMMTQRTCGKCGAPVQAIGPDKLCLNCLLDSAIESETLSPEIPIGSSAKAKPLRTESRTAPFGDYELLEELGRGGMGVVYKARQLSLNRMVAIKMLPFGSLATPQFVKRFTAEAAAAASLQHPNIITIHEVGVREGQYFFVMDYVEGQSLAHVASGAPVTPAQGARYIKTLAEAIEYAHRRGIIHRDLKPSNILVESATNHLRIADFGLARQIDGESTLTVTGQLLGSPNFMAPEQAAGGKLGKQTDIYGLGGILYFVLTARAPFQGVSLEAILQQVLNTEPISPRLLNPAVPRDLETICLKCLQKEPQNRYATGQQLAEELDRFLKDEPVQARPASPLAKMLRWRRRKPALAASLLVTLMLALILLLGSPIAAYRINRARKNAVDQGDKARTEARRAETSEFAARQSAYAADINLAGIALDESNLARAKELLDRYVPGSGKEDLRGWEWRYLRGRWKSDELATLKPRSENSKWIPNIAFSPEGRFLAAASQDGKVTLWNVKDRRRIGELLHGGAVRSISFSPRGVSLATAAVDRLMRIWDVGTLQEVWQAPAGFEMRAGAVAFSPDGTLLAWGGSSGTVLVSNLVSKTEFELETGEWGVTEIVFTRDGRTLATRNNQGRLRIWDVAARKINHVLPPEDGAKAVSHFRQTEPRLQALAQTVSSISGTWKLANCSKARPTDLAFPPERFSHPIRKR